MAKIQQNFRLSEGAISALERLAERHEVPKATVIEQAIHEFEARARPIVRPSEPPPKTEDPEFDAEVAEIMGEGGSRIYAELLARQRLKRPPPVRPAADPEAMLAEAKRLTEIQKSAGGVDEDGNVLSALDRRTPEGDARAREILRLRQTAAKIQHPVARETRSDG